MATARQTSIYHLTQDGWAVGDVPPADRVESWNCVVECTGRSQRYVEWTRVWSDSEVPETERDRLRWRFSEPVPGLRDWVA